MKRFYVKEITCELCKGTGIYNSECCEESEFIYEDLVDENNCYNYTDSHGVIHEVDLTCPRCLGEGYIKDETTKEGYRVYTEHELEFIEQPYYENPDKELKDLSVLLTHKDVAIVIAEYFGIIEFESEMMLGTNKYTYNFLYKDWNITYRVVPVCEMGEAKPLVPTMFNYRGKLCQVTSVKTMKRGVC